MAIYKNIVCTDTAELCTIAGRTFTKDVSGFALCGYYYITGGYTGPIVVSPTQSVAHYQPGNISSSNYVEVNGVKWYYTDDGYFQSGNRDASSGNYTLKLGSFSNARDCATYLVNLYYDLISTSVKPTGTGNVSVSYNNENAIVLANANGGYTFDYWELDGYTRLDYIESTGTQYIDTEVLYSNDLIEVEVGLSSTDTPSSTYKTLLGMYTASSNGTPFSIWTNSGFGQNFRDYVAGVNYPYAFDGTSQVFTFTNNSRTGSAYNIYLFKANAKGGNTYNGLSELKIEYAKIKVNNTLVRDYIPVIRHYDGAIGLLDLVHMCFYENKGTGSFIGGDVYAS